MTWRLVYIEESEYLSLYLDSLKVKRELDTIKIPLADIHSIIINNYKTTLTINLINKCMEYNINIVTCGIDNIPKGIIMPHSGHFKTTLVQREQISWSDNLKGVLWSEIVKAKLINQIQCLKINNKSTDVIEKLHQYINEVEKLDKTNREGLGAKIYFRALFGKEFKRFNEDTVNACLNYGYSILRSQISRTLVAKGLNTHFGIFHKGQYNNFNLSDDIIEVFRTVIDHYVVKYLQDLEFLNRETRQELIKITSTKILFKGKKQTVLNIINMYIDSILKFIDNGDFEALSFPILIDYEL